MFDPQLSEKIKVGTISQQKQISDFGGIMLVDGGSDGFILEDQQGNTCVIPTGIPIVIGGPGPMLSSFLRVNAPATGTLNCGFISQGSQGFKTPEAEEEEAPVDTTTYMTDKDGAYLLDKQGNNIEIKQ